MDLSPSFSELGIFLILFLILRVIYLKEPYPRSIIKSVKKPDATPVENWISNEVGVKLDVLKEFQSLGICVNEENIAMCINDIMLHTQVIEGHQSHFLDLLKLISPHGALYKHLVDKTEKKKKIIVMSEWLRKNSLMTSTTEIQLKINAIYSLDDLLQAYSYIIDSQPHKVSSFDSIICWVRPRIRFVET